jgi:hypothetical protein
MVFPDLAKPQLSGEVTLININNGYLCAVLLRSQNDKAKA